MKGVILAGGYGIRLRPCTLVTNKHLLPVADKPMVYYSIQTLKDMGIDDILIVTGSESAGDFMKLLGSGKNLNVNFTYRLQDGAGGIAEALSLAKGFVGNEKFAVILGDNIFEDNLKEDFEKFLVGGEEARIFLKEVPDPGRFGVAELKANRVVGIEEKPKQPKTNYAVTGLYMYSPNVFDIIKTLKPSARGEYEITDVNNAYIEQNSLAFSFVNGFWTDAGTFDSLFRATQLVREKNGK